MANRNLFGNQLSFEKKTVRVSALVNIGATGAPTLQMRTGPGNNRTLAAAPAGGFNGVKSITRLGAGQYRVVLQDNYADLIALRCGFKSDAVPAAPVVHAQVTGTDVKSVTSPQVTFICRNNAGAATDPANGEVMNLELELLDSSC